MKRWFRSPLCCYSRVVSSSDKRPDGLIGRCEGLVDRSDESLEAPPSVVMNRLALMLSTDNRHAATETDEE